MEFEENLTSGWSTGGDKPWFLAEPGYNSFWSARSGQTTSAGQTSWIERSFTPGNTITFYWKILGVTSNDCLQLFDGGQKQFETCGNTDWEKKTYTVKNGTIRWNLKKNSRYYSPSGLLDWVVWPTGSDDFEVPPTVFWEDNFEEITASGIKFFDDFEIKEKAEATIISEEIVPAFGALYIEEPTLKFLQWNRFEVKENILSSATDMIYSILAGNEDWYYPLYGYENINFSAIGQNQVSSYDISGLDYCCWPSLKLKANLKTQIEDTPSLDYWKLTYLLDLTDPFIEISRDPSGNVYNTDEVTLIATAFDQDPNQSGIGGGTITLMSSDGHGQQVGWFGGNYSLPIGSFQPGTTVKYRAEVYDYVLNYSETPTFSFTVANRIPRAENPSHSIVAQCSSAFSYIFSWDFVDDDKLGVGGDGQAAYQLQLDDNSDFSSPVWDSCNNGLGINTCLSGNSSNSHGLPGGVDINLNTNYYWRVKVKDKYGAWSDWSLTNSFKTFPAFSPNPSFTFSPLQPMVKARINFTDTSICYTQGGDSYLCKDINPDTGVYNTYLWDFGDGITDSNVGDTNHTFLNVGNYTVSLTITDSIATCSTSTVLKVILSLPQWRESSPGS